MNRLIRFLLLSILNILVWLLALIFRLLVLPLLLGVFRLLRDLVFLSFSASVYGPNRFIDRRAGEWTEHIVELVEDRRHVHEIYQLCRFLVGTIVVVGWIVATLFTVSILRIVFGFFT